MRKAFQRSHVLQHVDCVVRAPRRCSSNTAFIEKCPSPTCTCLDTPGGLDIDHESRLRNTVSFHRRHILVNTGDRPWPSRIEDDHDSYAAKVKATFGKNGALFDPRNLPLISAATFPLDAFPGTESPRLLVFPDFVSLPQPHTRVGASSGAANRALQDFAAQNDVDSLLGALRFHLKWANDANYPGTTERELNSIVQSLQTIHTPTILICGHGARDQRCGVLGPLLLQQFRDIAQVKDIECLTAQITHVGGHKFAGNVIIYIPNSGAYSDHALAGKSIWYGRVEPRHCEGILETTIERGKVIEELFRGSMSGAEP